MQLSSRRFLHAIASALLLVGASASAQGPAVSAAERARISSLVETKIGFKVIGVEQSPLPGFYQVIVDSTGSVYYVDTSGKWLFDGHLVDIDRKASVTNERKAQMNKDLPALDWKSLRMADAIQTSRGAAIKGRAIVTFEDPNCGFCKKLHADLAKIDNLTVYTFPVTYLGPESASKNAAIWCSADRGASWAAAMTGQRLPAADSCDTAAIQRNTIVAHSLKIRGTPTIFFADGSRVDGAIGTEALEKALAAQQARSR